MQQDVQQPSSAVPRFAAKCVDALRVYVISDVRLYSDGLASLLSRDPGIATVGSGALDARTMPDVIDARPDVLLVDAVVLRGNDFIEDVSRALPSALIVACGVTEETDEVIACAQRGAAGYVPREASADDLLRTLRGLERGELVCSPRIASVLFREMARAGMPKRGDDPADPLTTRERDVVALISRGLSNKEISVALNIEVATVKNHVHHILEKLSVKRRSAIVAHFSTGTYDRRVIAR